MRKNNRVYGIRTRETKEGVGKRNRKESQILKVSLCQLYIFAHGQS